jgi:hypothetical protein
MLALQLLFRLLSKCNKSKEVKLILLMALLLVHDQILSFLIPCTVDRTPWTGDQSIARPLPTHRTTLIRNNRTQTSMTWVEIEPTTPALKREKTVHALEREATVIGSEIDYSPLYSFSFELCNWVLQLLSLHVKMNWTESVLLYNVNEYISTISSINLWKLWKEWIF